MIAKETFLPAFNRKSGLHPLVLIEVDIGDAIIIILGQIHAFTQQGLYAIPELSLFVKLFNLKLILAVI